MALKVQQNFTATVGGANVSDIDHYKRIHYNNLS